MQSFMRRLVDGVHHRSIDTGKRTKGGRGMYQHRIGSMATILASKLILMVVFERFADFLLLIPTLAGEN